MANNRNLNQFVGIVENNDEGENARGPLAALGRHIAAFGDAHGRDRINNRAVQAVVANLGPHDRAVWRGANNRQRNPNRVALEAEAAALEAEIAGYEARAAEQVRVRNAAAAREAAINAGLDPFNTAFSRSLIPDDQMESLSNSAFNKEYKKITKYTKYRGWEGTAKRTAILEKERAEAQRLAGLGVNMNQYRIDRLAATARGNLPEFNARYATMVEHVGNRRVPGATLARRTRRNRKSRRRN